MAVGPTHRVSFADSDSIASIAYSADSREIFVALNVETISLWRVILNEWPYTIGALSMIVMLVGAVLLRRVLARPRRSGRMYCRKCNHEIAVRSVPCQECGRAVEQRRSIVRGRARWKRFAPSLTLMAAPMVIYVVLWVTPNSFYRPMWKWFDWLSDDALALARRHKLWWLERHAEDATRIAVVDVASGKRVRELGTYAWRFGHSNRARLVASPSGLILVEGFMSKIRALDPRTGRTLHVLGLNSQSYSHQVAGVSADGGTIYTTVHDHTNNRAQLVRFDSGSGQHTVVKSVDGGRFPPPRFCLVPHTTDVQFLEIPSQRELLEEDICTLRWFTESSPHDAAEVDIEMLSWPTLFLDKGRRACFSGPEVGGLFSVDLRSGSVETVVPAATLVQPLGGNSACRLIFGLTERWTIGAFDTVNKAWVPQQIMPPLDVGTYEDLIHDAAVAGNLNSIATHILPDGLGSFNELLIYDLTPYPKLRELEFGEEKK